MLLTSRYHIGDPNFGYKNLVLTSRFHIGGVQRCRALSHSIKVSCLIVETPQHVVRFPQFLSYNKICPNLFYPILCGWLTFSLSLDEMLILCWLFSITTPLAYINNSHFPTWLNVNGKSWELCLLSSQVMTDILTKYFA